jgi:hypothetical protein
LDQCEIPSAAPRCDASIEESAFTGTRGDAYEKSACDGHHYDPERCARAADARETARKAHALFWVDSVAHVYYLKGDKSFGKTKHGGYNCHNQADAAGYHASKSR